MVALQAQAKRQIDILHVAEEPFVEPVGIAKYVGTDQTGGRAGGEYLAFRGKRRQRPTVPPTPGQPDGEIVIAGAVEAKRIGGIELS